MERQYLDNCPDEKPKVSQFGAAKSSSLSKTYKNRGRRMNGPFGLRYLPKTFRQGWLGE